jgi:flagellar protein FlaI
MATDQAGPRGEEGGPEDAPVSRGTYTWAEFMEEHGHGAEVDRLYPGEDGRVPGQDPEFESVSFDPATYLGFDPAETTDRLAEGASREAGLRAAFVTYLEETPVVKDEYLWEHFKWEYYYEDGGGRPRDGDGEVVPFEKGDHLGFEAEDTEGVLSFGESVASELADVVDRRTVDVDPDIDEDAFFSDVEGHTTIVNRYDLEKAVPMEKKTHFREVDRYWTNKPYACVVLFHSERENEQKYYVVEPYRTPVESELKSFLTEKLRAAIKYASDDVVVEGDQNERRSVIDRETRKLLDRYDLYEGASGGEQSLLDTLKAMLGRGTSPEQTGGLDGIAARPEPVLVEEDADTLSEYQVEKLLYFLERDFIGYERIDGIKHDINVEDISCNGYRSPVFVYHTDHEQLITNVEHGESSLDDFVVKLAQRSGKGISKRQPQVDATLPDGSRSQLTLGREVSDHGTNYTIRQFNDIPFTPVDLINWHTFSLDQMAFLWLCIENHKSLIFAGGTASGKTTSLNAVSLFIPSNTKIVSIEDTREVELPQRNWIASVTRPSFSEDERGDIDEFDLLEAALRQRPDYIVMGEVRGEEGRTLFQVMSTGHTTYTTFHADSVSEVLKRFTTDPINVSKTLFTALDLVSIQRATRVGGTKVRRSAALTEINHYDAENDEINVQDVYQWIPEDDSFQQQPGSNTLESIAFDRGWSQDELEKELFKRRVVLAYLIDQGLNDYAQVAATAQAFIQDPDTILTLVANDQLEESLANLREMESVLIDVDQEKEEMVPRPDPGDAAQERVDAVLSRADEELLADYRGEEASDIALALSEAAEEAAAEDVVVTEPLSEESDPDDEESPEDGPDPERPDESAEDDDAAPLDGIERSSDDPVLGDAETGDQSDPGGDIETAGAGGLPGEEGDVPGPEVAGAASVDDRNDEDGADEADGDGTAAAREPPDDDVEDDSDDDELDSEEGFVFEGTDREDE